MANVRMLNSGEGGLVVEFGDSIDPETNRKVRRLADLLRRENIEGVAELVPTYRSLMVYFDPLVLPRRKLEAAAAELAKKAAEEAAGRSPCRTVILPVRYGGEFGPDLAFVAGLNGLTENEAVSIHSSRPYLVYMLGFMPGFPYLGGLSERIAAPRLEKPRLRIPAGSVGIAGNQTGFYPFESPGGWRLIGRTPLAAAFQRGPAVPLYSAGDYIRFAPISAEEYEDVLRRVSAGLYVPETTVSEEVPA